MRFITKLAAFAAALVAVILIFDLGDRGERRERRDHRRSRDVVVARNAVELKPIAGAPVAVGVIDRSHIGIVPGEVRIHTGNGAAFLALRGEEVVAGLSDSIRTLVEAEMQKEMNKHESGIGGAIENVVRSGVTKLLDKEIKVPVSEIREIDYRNNRIVISYKNGKPNRILDFEKIKQDDHTLLELFSEEDARRLVEAVKVKIATR